MDPGEGEPHRALVQAFDLADLDWIPGRRDRHGLQADAHVRKPGTALVLFALRWAGHAHTSIRDVAQRAGVPGVFLPGGPGPPQVAWQIPAQANQVLGLELPSSTPAGPGQMRR